MISGEVTDLVKAFLRDGGADAAKAVTQALRDHAAGRIRPSALQLAEHCGLANVLAGQFPESGRAAERGHDIHGQIAAGKPDCPESAAALAWLEGRKVLGKERAVRLVDPDWKETITEGTADVLLDEDGVLVVGDWKSGRPDNVEPADSNLQIATYGLAAAIELGYSRFQGALLFLDGPNVAERRSHVFEMGDRPALFDRIRRAAAKEPSATPGPHCGWCYQRSVCPSWRERAVTAMALLPDTGAALELTTDEQALEMLMRAKAVREAADRAEDMVRAYVLAGGKLEHAGKVYQQVMINGRRSGPSVDELFKLNLGHLVKPGKPYARWDWVREAATRG